MVDEFVLNLFDAVGEDSVGFGEFFAVEITPAVALLQCLFFGERKKFVGNGLVISVRRK